MAPDEDLDAERGGDRSGERQRQRGEKGERDAERERVNPFGISFSLPPISLPPLFPADPSFGIPRPVLPRLKPSTASVLAGALVLDLVDAALALGVAGAPGLDVPRTLVGTALAAVLFGPVGLAYAWELAALAAWPAATAAPTFLLLGLLRAVERRRRGHPEELDRRTERER